MRCLVSDVGCLNKALKYLNLKGVVYSLGNAWANLNDKVIVCLWKNLWPDMVLLHQYNKADDTNKGEINQ